MTVVTLHGTHLRSRSQEQPDHDGQGGVAASTFPRNRGSHPLATCPRPQLARCGGDLAEQPDCPACCSVSGASRSRPACRRRVASYAIWAVLGRPWRCSGRWRARSTLARCSMPCIARVCQPRCRACRVGACHLRFRRWRPGRSARNRAIPGRGSRLSRRPAGEPAIVVTPLLAFDGRGLPAGMGRRLLRPHAAPASGPAASRTWPSAMLSTCQQVERVPREPSTHAPRHDSDRDAHCSSPPEASRHRRSLSGFLAHLVCRRRGRSLGPDGSIEQICRTCASGFALDAVVVNGENAAGGYGLTAKIARASFEAGADLITLGNHSLGPAGARWAISTRAALVRPLEHDAGHARHRGRPRSALAVAAAWWSCR